MKNNLFQLKLMEEIRKKIPQKNKLVTFLTGLLGIEREAVYRRLRGEVPFSFSEVATICQKLSLSVDEMIDSTSSETSPFKLKVVEFTDPSDKDFNFMAQLYRFLSFIGNPASEACESSNIIPRSVYYKYKSITQFYLFKWYYHHNQTMDFKKYGDIIIDDRLQTYHNNTIAAAHSMGNTRLILDFSVIQYLINDLNYFINIHMITKDEMKVIKKELYEMLDYMEQLTLTGKFEDTGNPIQLYISHMNFASCYGYIQTTAYHITLVKAFILNAVISFDKSTFNQVKDWMNSLFKSSTLITESGEADRIRFFLIIK